MVLFHKPKLDIILLCAFATYSLSLPGEVRAAPSYIEISPLKTTLGLVGLRSELVTEKNLAASLFFEQSRHFSQRSDRFDWTHTFGSEYLWYPQNPDFKWLFLGVGGVFESSRKSYQAERGYVSDVNYNHNQRYNYWTVASQDFFGVATLGLRYSFQKIFTASFRYIYGKSLSSDQKIVDEEIRSQGFRPKIAAPSQEMQRFALYMGIAI